MGGWFRIFENTKKSLNLKAASSSIYKVGENLLMIILEFLQHIKQCRKYNNLSFREPVRFHQSFGLHS